MTPDASTVFLCCGGVLLLIVLIWVVRSFLEPTVKMEPVRSLLTPAEQKFYAALDAAIDGRFVILSKVRIADLFFISSSNSTARLRVFRSIASKHVDFVLAEPADLQPVAAIELDDSSHDRSNRRLRDQLLDELFEKAGFPLIRFRAATKYNLRQIQVEVGEVVQGGRERK
jgi:very-short-patch-repair endonuclease